MPQATHVAHVWVDDFFVRVERHANPALSGQPVVIGGSPGSAARVVAASVEAMACGIVPGLSLAEAARRCPDAAFRPGRLDQVLEAAAMVEEAVRRVAGPVEWIAIDEAVLDLAPLDRRRARRVAEELRDAIRVVGHDAAVGVADGRTAARMAARLARPQGVLVVLPGCDTRFLAGLDLACLDELDAGAQQRLRAAGVCTLGDLAARSPHDVTALLGRDGLLTARRAAGIDPRPVAPAGCPRRVCRQLRFEGAHDPPAVLRAVRDLVESGAAALRQFGWVAGSVTVRIEDAAGASASRSADIGGPTSCAGPLAAVAAGLALLLSTGRDVHAVAITLGRLSGTPDQFRLFDGPRPAAGRRW
jgi:DNA polymerase-4